MNLPDVITEVAFASDPGAASPSWTDLSDRLVAANTKRGRTRELDRFQAGKATYVLKSSDRALEPEYAASPYYPNVVPQRRARLRVPKYQIVVGLDAPASWYRFQDDFDFAIQVNEVPGAGGALGLGTQQAHIAGPVLGGRAVDLDGLGYLRASTHTAQRVAFTGDMSLEAWIYRNNNAAVHCIAACQELQATKNAWELRMQNAVNTLRFAHANNSTVENFTSAGGVAVAGWHHVVVTRTGGRVYFYIDGSPDSDFAQTITPTAGVPAFEIGRRPSDGTQLFNGSLAEVAVYGRALSAAEVAEHFAAAADSYGVFDGYVDGWPPKWRSNAETLVDVDVTDGFEYLNIQLLRTVEYEAEILADNPRAYYRLGDNPLAEFAADSSGNSRHAQPTLQPPLLNTEGALIADLNGGATFPGDGYLAAGNPPVPTNPTGAFTVEWWVKSVDPGAGGMKFWRIEGDVPSAAFPTPGFIQAKPSETGWFVMMSDAFPGGAFGITYLDLLSDMFVVDGDWHHLAVVYNGGTSWLLYTDGVARPQTGPAAWHLPTNPRLNIGGHEFAFVLPDDELFIGSMDEFAIYGTALSASRIQAHYQQGAGAWASQLSGTRVHQVLDTIGWPAGARQISAGRTVMPAVTARLIDTSALEHLQAVAAAEAGYLFMSGDGDVVSRDRYAYLFAPYRSSQATFGDGPGELPYTTGGIEPTYDKTEIWTHAEFTREGGKVQEFLDDAAADRYGIRTLTESGLLLTTDGEAYDRAGYYVARFKAPLLRFRQIELDPTAFPALWPIVLGVEIGDLVTVVRRPAGGGTALTKQVRIEGIEHDFDADDRTWLTTLMLSPLDLSLWAVTNDPVLSILNSGILVGY